MALTANFAALLILATLVMAQAPTCARFYQVVSGDTCNGISTAQNVSSFQITHVNTIINPECTNLVVGEALCLGVVGQDCNVTTVVQTGDFCALIADRANISVPLLLQNNPNIDPACDNILVEEVLCTSTELFHYT